MRPLTERRPKPMLPVAGRPLVAAVAEAAVAAGATELVFTVGYEGDQVRSYFGDTFAGVPVNYATQSEQQGTADAVAAAKEHLDGEFAVLNGDNLYRGADLEALFENGPSVACTRVENPSNYGVLSTTDGVVTDIIEKPDDPTTDLANAGAYVFPDAARDRLAVPPSERGERELTDVLGHVVERHAVHPILFDEWLDVGRPWELLAANERRLDGLDHSVEGAVHAEAVLRGAVAVEPGARVGPGTVIEGPVRVQRGATVGPNAHVRGKTVLGPDTAVSHAAEVENSVVLPGATVESHAHVADSILGESVTVGAGTRVANRRHDGRDVQFTVKGEQVSTGRQLFGTVLGDEVTTGVHTTIDPGVRMEPAATTAPNQRVSRDR